MLFRPSRNTDGALKKIAEAVYCFGVFDFARLCFCLVVLFCTNCFFAQAQSQSQTQTPHPAVVRVFAQHGEVTSLGSGMLIAKKTNYGFVITNWHVVRDTNGHVRVRFPDHRDYEAVVVAVDDRWDLALLVIAEPKGVDPVVISPTIPKIGEYYWAAGYRGDGTYRIQGGRCKAFQQPEPSNIEAELIEIEVPSENGCSGGPVFNAKKELAGVLFGSDKATTMASHCGRVIKFLEQAASHVASLPTSPESVIKAASLSQQSIVQRGAVASGSSATRGSNNPATPSPGVLSSVSSSSSSFGGSGIRSRAISSADSQQLTRLERHGFLLLHYDITAANTLLAAESRRGTSSQNNTQNNYSTSDRITAGGIATTSSPSSQLTARTTTVGSNNVAGSSSGSSSTVAVSDNSVRSSQPTGVVQPASITQPITRAADNTPAATPYSGYSGSSPRSSGSNSTAANTYVASTAETIPSSSSRTAVTTPSYSNDANRVSGNSGSINGRTNRQISGNQTTGSTSNSATGSFDASFQRKTETSPGGMRDTTGGTSTGVSGGTTSGGRTDSSTKNYNTYGRNSAASPSSDQTTASQNTARGSSLWVNDDTASQYALDISDMQADDFAPKYADGFDAAPAGADATGAGSKFDAIKIVVAILVIFFILFHTIKTMANAEERQTR